MDPSKGKRLSEFEKPAARSVRGRTPIKASTEPPQPKPKFTASQQLAIIERIQKGDFKKGAGLSQFCVEPKVTGSCTKNLKQKFREVAGDATKVADMGMPLHSSTGIAEDLVNEVEDSVQRMHLDLDMDFDEDYNSLPWYIKQIDKLIVYHETFRNHLSQMAEARGRQVFRKHCPVPDQIVAAFLKKVKGHKELLENFNKRSMVERMKVLAPAKKTAKKAVPVKATLCCDIKKQKDVVDAIYSVKKLMDMLDQVPVKDSEVNWSAELENMKNMIDIIEDRIMEEDNLTNEENKRVSDAERLEVLNEHMDSSPESSMYSSPLSSLNTSR